MTEVNEKDEEITDMDELPEDEKNALSSDEDSPDDDVEDDEA